MSVSTVLALIFVTLKLCKVIDWSWWWVLAPVWISVGITILALALFAILGISDLKEKARKKEREEKIMELIRKNSFN
jgi:heme exporter protein D